MRLLCRLGWHNWFNFMLTRAQENRAGAVGCQAYHGYLHGSGESGPYDRVCTRCGRSERNAEALIRQREQSLIDVRPPVPIRLVVTSRPVDHDAQ